MQNFMKFFALVRELHLTNFFSHRQTFSTHSQIVFSACQNAKIHQKQEVGNFHDFMSSFFFLLMKNYVNIIFQKSILNATFVREKNYKISCFFFFFAQEKNIQVCLVFDYMCLIYKACNI